jgi:hypothetical protein
LLIRAASFTLVCISHMQVILCLHFPALALWCCLAPYAP